MCNVIESRNKSVTYNQITQGDIKCFVSYGNITQVMNCLKISLQKYNIVIVKYFGKNYKISNIICKSCLSLD